MNTRLVLIGCLWCLVCGPKTFAQVTIDRVALGSGTPGAVGFENATRWDLDLYHVPQYLPGYPTSATIFPRAINILCIQNAVGLNCRGYNWSPEMGRAEYLLVRPVLVKEFPGSN